MRRAGRLDVQSEVGELSVIKDTLGGESRALLPLDSIPAAAMGLLRCIHQHGFATEKLFGCRFPAGGHHSAVVDLHSSIYQAPG